MTPRYTFPSGLGSRSCLNPSAQGICLRRWKVFWTTRLNPQVRIPQMNEAPNRVHVSRRDSVESGNDHSYRRIIIAAKTLFWLALAFILIQQLWASWWPDLARGRLLSRLQNERKSRVIAMIHRQETVNFLGVPVSSYLNIEDSEEVLRAIRLTPDEQPIDLILHTLAVWCLRPSKLLKPWSSTKEKSLSLYHTTP